MQVFFYKNNLEQKKNSEDKGMKRITQMNTWLGNKRV